MKITQPFTFAAVGDIIIRRAFADGEPGFQALTKVMREADMTYANMEGPIVDLASFSGPLYQDFRGPKTVADDLKRMGVRMMTTANNHTLDSGAEGMFETHRLLEAAGILHAGSGKNLAEARMARTAATPKGTVAAIGLYAIDASSNPPRTRFYDATATTPGLNPLHLNVWNVVSADQMRALKQIRDSVYARRSEVPLPVAPVPANEPANRLRLFQTGFTVGARPGDLSYEIDQDDLRAIITSVRVGKQLADFLVVGIHCHQNSFAFQAYSHDNHTPDFLIEFAHQMIDNGADAFVGHGVHTLRGDRDLQREANLLRCLEFLLSGRPGGRGDESVRAARRSGRVGTPACQHGVAADREPIRRRQAGGSAPLPRRPRAGRNAPHLPGRESVCGVPGDGASRVGEAPDTLEAVRHENRDRERDGRHPRGGEGRELNAGIRRNADGGFVSPVIPLLLPDPLRRLGESPYSRPRQGVLPASVRSSGHPFNNA